MLLALGNPSSKPVMMQGSGSGDLEEERGWGLVSLGVSEAGGASVSLWWWLTPSIHNKQGFVCTHGLVWRGVGLAPALCASGDILGPL